jgi:hypothetical protein
MSIQPIDLQTLFMRLSQVGKEQAAMREAAHVAQTVQGSEIAKRSEEQAKTVNETRELEEGPDAIKEEEQRSGRGREESEENRERKQAQKDKKKKHVFQDPQLGTKIDLSG